MNLSNYNQLKENYNKILKCYTKRKYYVSELTNIIHQTQNILTQFANNSFLNAQIGGVKMDEFVSHMEEFNKKISVLGTQDFKNLVETFEQVVDVFDTTSAGAGAGIGAGTGATAGEDRYH